jgi:hypothetical protein
VQGVVKQRFLLKNGMTKSWKRVGRLALKVALDGRAVYLDALPADGTAYRYL